MINNVRDFLLEVRHLIEKGWCQYELAEDAYGRPCHPLSDEAVCYCLDGALSCVYVKKYYVSTSLYVSLIYKEAKELLKNSIILYKYKGDKPPNYSEEFISDIASFNDTVKDVSEVLKVIDMAIEAEEKRGTNNHNN